VLFDKQNPKEDRTSERDFCPTLGFDVKKIPLVYLESSSPGRLYFLFLLAGKKRREIKTLKYGMIYFPS